MSYGTLSFWDIYSSGLHPVCGTAVVVIAFAVFIAGVRDHRERRLFWVATILAVSLLGFFIGEWGRDSYWLSRVGPTDGLADPIKLGEWTIRTLMGRMMFMAQAGLAVAFALGLLWWPIRPKAE